MLTAKLAQKILFSKKTFSCNTDTNQLIRYFSDYFSDDAGLRNPFNNGTGIAAVNSFLLHDLSIGTTTLIATPPDRLALWTRLKHGGSDYQGMIKSGALLLDTITKESKSLIEISLAEGSS